MEPPVVSTIDSTANRILFQKLVALLPSLADITADLQPDDHNELAIFGETFGVLHTITDIADTQMAAARCRLDALKDKLFELINTGHWSRVPMAVRRAYTLSTYLSALFTIYTTNPMPLKRARQIVFHLDHGLLLGSPLRQPHDQLLAAAIEHITAALRLLAVPAAAQCPPIPPMPQHCRSADELTGCDLPVLQRPTLEQFRREHFDPLRPAILTDCMAGWPAMRRWCDTDYLLESAGERTVPIEIGSSYTQADWSQELQRFGDFLRRHLVGGESETAPDQPVEYLAQHNLFDQIPALRADLIVPEYCCLRSPVPADGAAATTSPTAPAPADVDIRAWLGPSGTVSPAHTDPKHNLLCQVFGHKQIILAAPCDTGNMYAHGARMLHNTSQLNAEAVDTERFPRAAAIRWYRMRLYRGEMLYIPPGWWHHVRALERSFSVSFWWE